MNELVFNIVFSTLLLPINLLCGAWMLKDAMNLTGMTFGEYWKLKRRQEQEEFELTEPPVFTDSEDIELSKKTIRMDASQRETIFFFKHYSSDPKRSLRLTKAYAECTFIGFSALFLSNYTALSRNPDKLNFALIGNIILLIFNLGLFFAGKIYRNRHPIDERILEELRAKRAEEKENGKRERVRNIIVYIIVGLVFLGGMIYVNLSMAGVFSQQKHQVQQGTPTVTTNVQISREKVHEELTERGFETANIPTTYWREDEKKLMNVCSGVKNDIKFEYYEYSDNQTTDLVYNSIVYTVSSDMEPSERRRYEKELPEGNKIFAAKINGVYQLCIYRDNTVVYAYSENGSTEINSILYKLGYLQTE